MKIEGEGKLLRIFVGESDRWHGKPLYQAIVERGRGEGLGVGARRRKLIVVSNRGPVTYGRDNGERVTRRGGGGLVTALRGLVAHHDVTWVASAMTEEDRAVVEEAGGEAVEETLESG